MTDVKAEYLKAGKTLMPLDVVVPIHKDWPKKTYSNDYLLNYNGNLGWVLGEDDLVIDVDPRNFKNGVDSFEKLKELLGLKLTPQVLTPSGGFHIYLSRSDGMSLRKKIRDFPGIDFLTKGAFCLIVGDSKPNGIYEWEDDFLGCFYQEKAPSVLIDLLCYTKIEEDEDDLSSLVRNSKYSEKDIVKKLDGLDPSMENDGWVKVGMGLHSWHKVDGLRLWENWSKGGTNYKEGETNSRWRSFDNIAGGVSLGTLNHMVKEVTYETAKSKVSALVDSIKVADDKRLEFDIFPQLKKEDFSKVDIEVLAKTIQDRYKELTGARIPISTARSFVTKVEVISGEFVETEDVPKWCKDWVYVNSHSCFAQLSSLKLYKSESFNIANGRYVPPGDNGSKQSAVRYISDGGFMESVDSMAYMPSLNSSIYEKEGRKILNIFNPGSVPKEDEEYVPEGKAAIALIQRHLKFIFGTDENAEIFTQWLAHQIQHKGKKILWSPVIQSIEGIGKSFFGELLRVCLGDTNVGTVAPTQVLSDFNGWATGVCVNILEELRVAGQNRHGAVNSLKPLITDRMIQINDKGVKQFMTYNTTNYICFTNFKDSLPLSEDDRRWWVIFVPIESLDDITKAVGEDARVYLDKLFTAVRENGGQIHKWLKEYKISDKFMATKQAPMTDYKMTMIATEEGSIEGLSEAKELIAKGSKWFNKDVISSSDLFDSLMVNYSIDVANRSRHAILKKLGYSVLPNTVTIQGKSKRVWVKKILTNEEVRGLLG